MIVPPRASSGRRKPIKRAVNKDHINTRSNKPLLFEPDHHQDAKPNTMPGQPGSDNNQQRPNMTAETIKEHQLTKPQHKVKSKRITPTERQVIKSISEGKTIRETAEITGLNENYISGQMLIKPKIADAITQLMDKAGLSDREIVDHHHRLITAKRKLYNPTTQTYDDVDDNQVQSSMVALAYKVKGHLKDNPETNTNIQINLVKYGADSNVIAQPAIELEGKVIDITTHDDE